MCSIMVGSWRQKCGYRFHQVRKSLQPRIFCAWKMEVTIPCCNIDKNLCAHLFDSQQRAHMSKRCPQVSCNRVAGRSNQMFGGVGGGGTPPLRSSGDAGRRPSTSISKSICKTKRGPFQFSSPYARQLILSVN